MGKIAELMEKHLPPIGPGAELPKSAQYRSSRPGLAGRFADAWRAEDSLTEAIYAKARNVDPSRFAWLKSALEARQEQYPALNLPEKAASFLGGAAKQVLDPAGVLIAAATKTPMQAAIGGAGYEAGTSVMQDVAQGRDIDAINATTRGIAGGTGAGIADAVATPALSRVAGSAIGGVVPELAGRLLGIGILGESTEAQVAQALAGVIDQERQKRHLMSDD
jgi:hypothetical protein